MSTSMALAKRASDDSLMPPPPPLKRIKRPPKVLDEDEYISALSDIIARDFFPGLVEAQSQQEYLNALESNDPALITAAGKRLVETMTPGPRSRRARATRLNPNATPRPDTTSRFGGDTPKGWGGATPSEVGTEFTAEMQEAEAKSIDTSTMSLSAFQQKYTSEDNESFNDLLDKQNIKRHEKYAFLWNNNKIPAPRQLLHRAREAKLLAQSQASDSQALVPMTNGATDSRPAQPAAWSNYKPDNTFMFNASSVEDETETIAQRAQTESRAAPKQTMYANTRLQPLTPAPQPSVPPSPSLSAVRDAIAGRPRLSASEIGSDVYTGAETPRVNGYAFVDEDEPEPTPQPTPPEAEQEPSYRDLLAGQTSEGGINPFTISSNRKREELHHRMVEKTAKGKREKKKEVMKTPIPSFPSSPMIGGRKTPVAAAGETGSKSERAGAMTPAARKLMEKIGGGKTPIRDERIRSGLRNMWTPTPKPIRKSSRLGN